MSEVKSIVDIQKKINEEVKQKHLKMRDGGGNKKLSYVENGYVQTRLDEVFGAENWDYEITQHPKIVLEDTTESKYNGQPRILHVFVATASVRLTVRFRVGDQVYTKVVEDSGACDANDQRKAEAIQMALKGAITDAKKRAATDIGNTFGRSLQNGVQPYSVGEFDLESSVNRTENTQTSAAEKPADKPVDKPVEKTVEKSTEKTTDKPADKAVEKKNEKAVEKPVDSKADAKTTTQSQATSENQQGSENPSFNENNKLAEDILTNISSQVKEFIDDAQKKNVKPIVALTSVVWRDAFSIIKALIEQSSNTDEWAITTKRYSELLKIVEDNKDAITAHEPTKAVPNGWVNSIKNTYNEKNK